VQKLQDKPGRKLFNHPSEYRSFAGDPGLRSRRQPVYRRHELDTGFGTERENFVLDEKGNDKWQKNHEEEYRCQGEGRIIL
jgi:hypothetical protein